MLLHGHSTPCTLLRRFGDAIPFNVLPRLLVEAVGAGGSVDQQSVPGNDDLVAIGPNVQPERVAGRQRLGVPWRPHVCSRGVKNGQPPLAPLAPKMRGRRAPLPPRTAILVVAVAVAAFVAGMQVSPTRQVPVPAPTAAVASSSPAVPASSASAPALVTPAPPPPLGVYSLNQREAGEIALAARFYAAYDAGQLSTLLALLDAQPQLSDCNYATRSAVSLSGSRAVDAYLRARLAEHDHWTVEFQQVNPANSFAVVVVVPLARSNDTLRRLGAPGGVKRSFPEDLYLGLNADGTRVQNIAWSTMSGSTATLCSP